MNNQRLATLRAKKWYHILPVKAGQMLELHEKVWEWSNKRIWKFKWLVIKVKKPNHVDGTFVIRGKSAGHTIEKIYPLSFTKFDKVIVVDEFRARRAKLYYLRDKVGKDAKMKSISTAEQRWVDLLALAIAHAEELHSPFAEKKEEKTEDTADEAKEEVKAEETKTEDKAEAKEEKVEEVKEEAKAEEKAEEQKEEKQEKEEEQKEEESEQSEESEESQE